MKWLLVCLVLGCGAYGTPDDQPAQRGPVNTHVSPQRVSRIDFCVRRDLCPRWARWRRLADLAGEPIHFVVSDIGYACEYNPSPRYVQPRERELWSCAWLAPRP